jgi:hypothetical protein
MKTIYEDLSDYVKTAGNALKTAGKFWGDKHAELGGNKGIADTTKKFWSPKIDSAKTSTGNALKTAGKFLTNKNNESGGNKRIYHPIIRNRIGSGNSNINTGL